LSNIFGSYLLEDDDENAIFSISFLYDGKAVNYFIQFAKYQNCICWDNWALQKIVKDAIPSRIKDELWYSQKNILSFERFNKAVLRIDNDYWRRIQNKRSKTYTERGSQNYSSKPLKQKGTKLSWSEGKENSAEQGTRLF